MKYNYAIGQCYFGYVLVVSNSNKEICEVSLGFNEKDLCVKNDCIEGQKDNLNKVINLINNPKLNLDTSLPNLGINIHMEGTDFQKLVWKSLIYTLPGTVLTYTELASMISSAEIPQNMSRAVANACAANKLFFLVPCHRVVRKDGKSSGYKWGKIIKEILLYRERHLDEDASKIVYNFWQEGSPSYG